MPKMRSPNNVFGYVNLKLFVMKIHNKNKNYISTSWTNCLTTSWTGKDITWTRRKDTTLL